MIEKEIFEIFCRRLVVCEAIGVFKDAAANHKAVDIRILIFELLSHLAIFDVAVDDEFGLGGDSISQLDDFGDKLVMR